jgi:hypothetical protein
LQGAIWDFDQFGLMIGVACVQLLRFAFSVKRRKASRGEMNDAPDRNVVVFTEALRLPAAERAG